MSRHLLPLLPALPVGDREARADCQRGELIDRIAASAPVRKLPFVEKLRHTRVPFARLAGGAMGFYGLQ